MTSALNPTARPSKPPALASIPSTPGPELPGGYPRNSVVFATNQWDRSTAPKGKRGLLASFLPTKTSTSSSSASPARPRPSSIGHTPGIALHLNADRESSDFTLGDFPTPGGQTFASRASSALQPTESTPAEGDYFGAAAAAVVAESSATAPSSAAEPAGAAPRTDAEGPTKAVEPAHGAEPTADAPSNSLPLPLPLPVQPPANASPSTVASTSSGGTSALSTSTAPSSVPSPSPSPLPISSPKPLARQKSPAAPLPSASSTDKPRPAITYSPSTFGARPAVTKAGSALSPMRSSFSVARSAGAGAIAEGAEGSTNSSSPGASGGTPVTGRGLGNAMKRYTSLRLRRRGDKDAGGHARAASSASAAPGSPALSSPASPSPPIASASELGVVAEGGEKSASAKPSRRASLMRTLRGVAGRVGVRG